MAQRGALEVKPSRVCATRSSTLMTTPSISCSALCRCSPKYSMKAHTSSSVATTREWLLTGNPQPRSTS